MRVPLAATGTGGAAGRAVVVVHTQLRLHHHLTVEVEVSAGLVYKNTTGQMITSALLQAVSP